MPLNDKQAQPEGENQISVALLDARLVYCDNALISFSENGEDFTVTLASGGVSPNRYTFHPKHLKRLSLLLQTKIAEYEEKFGVLDTSLPEPDHPNTDE